MRTLKNKKSASVKKVIIFATSAMLIGVIGVLCYVYGKPPKWIIDTPQFIDKLRYDPTVFYDLDGNYGYIAGSEVTWLLQLTSQEHLDAFSEEFGVDVQAMPFDFATDYYFVSFGRRLVEARFCEEADHYGRPLHVTVEDAYEGNTLFIYRSPHYAFAPFDDQIGVFRLQNWEHVYWGQLNEINRRDPSLPRGI